MSSNLFTGLSQSKASLVSIKVDEIYTSFDILLFVVQFKVNNHVKMSGVVDRRLAISVYTEKFAINSVKTKGPAPCQSNEQHWMLESDQWCMTSGGGRGGAWPRGSSGDVRSRGERRHRLVRSEEKIRIMGSRSQSKITIDNPLEKTKGWIGKNHIN